MGNTSIEWTATINADGSVTPGRTWNPVRGCSRVSPGCKFCYAETIAARFSDEGSPFHLYADRAKSGSKWTGKVDLIEDKLLEPLAWRKPSRVFVNSMSDLFHEELPFEEIDRVLSVMVGCRKHTFQILTKRADRMLKYFQRFKLDGEGWMTPHGQFGPETHCPIDAERWPLPNVWLGVSAEDQQRADERIPLLLQTPAAVRFVSYEPALGPVDFRLNDEFPDPDGCYADARHGLQWIIGGAESGRGARHMDEAWMRSVRDQCVDAGVAFFYKQNAAKGKKIPTPMLDGRQWMEFPK